MQNRRRGLPEWDVCVYCGGRANTWDHVVPRAEGGHGTRDNIVRACRSCNALKGSRSLVVFLATRQRVRWALPQRTWRDGERFRCPSCCDPVYHVAAKGRVFNLRVKGQPRAPHDCIGFVGGVPR